MLPHELFLGVEKLLAERGLIAPGDLEAWMRGAKPTGRPTVPPPIMPEASALPKPSLFCVATGSSCAAPIRKAIRAF
jgi:hypothetical protein